MSYQEKNSTVSLISGILILGYYLLRLFRLNQSGELAEGDVYRLWVIIIVATVLVNIVGMILAHIFSAVAQAVQTQAEPEIEDTEDERDRLIKLKGTRVAYIVITVGVFIAMLTLVIGRPPLMMFNLLIFFGILAGIAESISCLIYSYRGV